MKQKNYILIAVIAILFIIVVGVFVYLNYPQNQTDARCNWEAGLCKNICQSQNYFFDQNSKECKKYVEPGINKGCCTPPPFETIEECKSVCE